jgi:hypothetical protein
MVIIAHQNVAVSRKKGFLIKKKLINKREKFITLVISTLYNLLNVESHQKHIFTQNRIF